MMSVPVFFRVSLVLVFAKVSFAWIGSGPSKKDDTLNLEHPSFKRPLESLSSGTILPGNAGDLTMPKDPSISTTRRYILGSTTRVAIIPFFIATTTAAPQSSNAAAPLDAGEAIRRGAANIPGYGSSDVFYPESFAGSWKATRDVQFPSGSSSEAPPTLRLTYPVRFIRSIEDDAVVADRGYNQAELEAAVARRGSKTLSESSTSSSPVVLSYDWVANNPNIVTVALADGTKKEIKVTKRATERTSSTVSSSEFQRITQEDTRQQASGGPGAVPQISARRVVSKWKQVDESTLEGIEIVYAVGGGGDPLSTSLPGQQQPVSAVPIVLSKSRLYLVR